MRARPRRPRSRHRGRGPSGGPESLNERCRGGVAAVGGEDRGEDCDPEHAPQRVQRVVGARGHADVAGRHRAGDGVGHGGEAHRDAHPGDDQRRDQGAVAHPRLGDRRQPAQPGGLHDQAADHERPVADLVGEGAGDRRDQHGRRHPDQDPQPSLQRGVAQPDLEQLGDEEQGPDQRDELEEDHRVRGGEAAAAEVGQGQHRIPGPPFPGQEPGQRRAQDEHQQAEDVHAAAAEPVAQRRAGQHQAAEDQVVGVDGPLQVGQARPQA